MFKFLGGLLGAGGITGLFSLAPWIIAAVVALAGAGGFIWKQHDLDSANAALSAKQAQVDTLNRDLGAALTANEVNRKTIAAQQANNEANDALIANYQHQIEDSARASLDAGKQIKDLQNAHADVDAFLRLPIPPALLGVLNHEPVDGATSGGADGNSGGAATKAK